MHRWRAIGTWKKYIRIFIDCQGFFSKIWFPFYLSKKKPQLRNANEVAAWSRELTKWHELLHNIWASLLGASYRGWVMSPFCNPASELTIRATSWSAARVLDCFCGRLVLILQCWILLILARRSEICQNEREQLLAAPVIARLASLFVEESSTMTMGPRPHQTLHVHGLFAAYATVVDISYSLLWSWAVCPKFWPAAGDHAVEMEIKWVLTCPIEEGDPLIRFITVLR